MDINLLKFALMRVLKAADKMAEALCEEYPYVPTSVTSYSNAKDMFNEALQEYNNEKKEKIKTILNFVKESTEEEVDLSTLIEDEMRAESIELSNLQVDMQE